MSITSVVTKIGSAAKKFSGKPLATTSKILGAATLAAVVYDTHVNGRVRANSYDEVQTADRYEKHYKQYMTMDKESQTVANMKNQLFRMQQAFPWYHIGSRANGYFDGASKTILDNLALIGLSAAALATKKTKVFGKAAGILLAANGLKTVFYDVLGVGAPNKKYNN